MSRELFTVTERMLQQDEAARAGIPSLVGELQQKATEADRLVRTLAFRNTPLSLPQNDSLRKALLDMTLAVARLAAVVEGSKL